MKAIRRSFIAACLFAGLIFAFVVKAQGPCGDSYVVSSGDTISQIAELCNTTVTAILEANPAVTDPTRIFAGQTLVIPEPEALEPGPLVVLSPVCGPPGTEVLLIAGRLPANASIDIGVGRKVTEFNKIGQARTNANGRLEYAMSIPETSEPNKTLLVILKASTGGPAISALSNPFFVTPPVENPLSPVVYTVQQGDTLRSIASRFDQSIVAIIAANPGITSPNLITPGQRLVIPGREPTAAAVRLAPVCGPPGAPIQLVASNFPAGVPVDVTLGKRDTKGEIVERGITSAQGSLTMSLTIPSSAKRDQRWAARVTTTTSPRYTAGSNTFTVIPPLDPHDPTTYIVKTGDTLNELADQFGRSVFQILSANPEIDNPNQLPVGLRLIVPGQAETLAISPTSGPPRTVIQVQGSNFEPESKVELGVAQKISDFSVLTTAITDSSGSFTAQLPIPASATRQERWLVIGAVQESGKSKVVAISSPFNVTGSQATPSYQPSIDIWPESGPPGTELYMTGSGFPKEAIVEVGIQPQEGTLEQTRTAWADINGTFAAVFTIPQDAALDQNWTVSARTLAGKIVQANSKPFKVTGGAAP